MAATSAPLTTPKQRFMIGSQGFNEIKKPGRGQREIEPPKKFDT
jgi:hypothetical protein